jgi:hypothetical protein
VEVARFVPLTQLAHQEAAEREPDQRHLLLRQPGDADTEARKPSFATLNVVEKSLVV